MSIIFQNFLFLEKFSIHGWTHIGIVCSIQLSIFMFRSVCVNEVWVYHVLGWFLVSILISKFILHLQIYFIIVHLFPPRKDSPVGWVVYLGLCLHYNLWISWIGLGPFNLFFKINQTLNEPKVFIYFISAWKNTHPTCHMLTQRDFLWATTPAVPVMTCTVPTHPLLQ